MKNYSKVPLLLSLAPNFTHCAPIELGHGASIDIAWDPDSEQVVMTTKVPANTWLGFGWGPDMEGTSMISWSANGANSYQTDLYSETSGMPNTIDPNCYTTTTEDNSDHVVFTSKRPLDCGDGYYVVELDKQSSWVSAWDDGY